MQAEMQTAVTRHADASQTGAGGENAVGRDLQTFPVGYKKPPVQHRFKKGCSGNPGGRPRKQGAEAALRTQKTVEDVLLEEAQRPVSIREGDKVVKLSTIQAVVRSLAVAAMKGDRRSQLAFRDLTETVETRRRESKNATFKGMLAYKDRCQAEIARCKAFGVEPPEFLPHPDDVKMDFRTGDIGFVGPMDERQKHLWDEVQVEKNEILGKLVRLDDVIRLYPRKRKVRSAYLRLLRTTVLVHGLLCAGRKGAASSVLQSRGSPALDPSAVAPNARRPTEVVWMKKRAG